MCRPWTRLSGTNSTTLEKRLLGTMRCRTVGLVPRSRSWRISITYKRSLCLWTLRWIPISVWWTTYPLMIRETILKQAHFCKKLCLRPNWYPISLGQAATYHTFQGLSQARKIISTVKLTSADWIFLAGSWRAYSRRLITRIMRKEMGFWFPENNHRSTL